MQARQHPLVFLSATLLVTLTSQSSIAFNIKQNPGAFDYTGFSLFLGRDEGYTMLNASDPEDPFSAVRARPFVSPIKLGGTDGLLADLQLYRNED